MSFREEPWRLVPLVLLIIVMTSFQMVLSKEEVVAMICRRVVLRFFFLLRCSPECFCAERKRVAFLPAGGTEDL